MYIHTYIYIYIHIYIYIYTKIYNIYTYIYIHVIMCVLYIYITKERFQDSHARKSWLARGSQMSSAKSVLSYIHVDLASFARRQTAKSTWI